MPHPRVIPAAQVADLLNCSEATFRAKRLELETKHNFPPRLPGCNGWSAPAVARWIETNGENYLPAADAIASLRERDAVAIAAAALEDEYAGARQ